DATAHRQAADVGGLRVPPEPGPTLRRSGRRALVRRKLSLDGVQAERASLPTRPGDRARARRTVHPARGPRAELLDERTALRGERTRGPLFGGGRGGRRAWRPAPRRSQR